MKKYAGTLDALGQIALPDEILKANGIESGAVFYIKPVAEGILLVPADGCCTLCCGVDGLTEISGGFICSHCAEKLREAV